MSSVMLPLFLPEGFSIDKRCARRSPSSCSRRPTSPRPCAAVCRRSRRAVRRRGFAGPELLAADAQDHPAAGAEDRDPAAGEHLHRAVQDTSLVVIIGIFDLTLAAKAAVRRGMARVRGGGVPVHLAHLLRVLLFHVQIQPGAGTATGHWPRATTARPPRGGAHSDIYGSTGMSDAIIRLQDVNKWYGQFHVLRNINLDVAPGNASWSADRRVPASPP